MSKPLPVWQLLLRWGLKSLGPDDAARALAFDPHALEAAASGSPRADTEPIARAVLCRWGHVLERELKWVHDRHNREAERRLAHV